MFMRKTFAGVCKYILAMLCFCLAAANLAAGGKKEKAVTAPVFHPAAGESGIGEDGWKYGFFTTDDGASIHYEEFGTGGKTILFVHGYLDSGASFKYTARYLTGDYRIVIYDERAHGFSDAPGDGYTMDRYAKDLKNLIDFLELTNINIIGYSMGAHIIFEYIKQFGESAFDKIIFSTMSPKILNDAAYSLGISGVDLTAAFTQMAWTNSSFTAVFEAQRDQFKDFLATNQLYRDFYDKVVTYSPSAMTCLLVAMYSADYWSVLPQITRPVLFVTAENDMYPMAGFERQKKMVKGPAEIVVIPKYNHQFMWNDPAAYAAEIQKFIQ
jgi:pimeloyl-ACP methyl ester carboxylesterase